MRLLFVLCDFYISGLSAERIKRFAAVLVELSEKFNILQTAGVNESTQRVDGQVKNMADDENNDQRNGSADAASEQSAHGVDDLGYDPGCKAQGQDSGVGQNIRQITGDVVDVSQSPGDLAETLVMPSAG